MKRLFPKLLAMLLILSLLLSIAYASPQEVPTDPTETATEETEAPTEETEAPTEETEAPTEETEAPTEEAELPTEETEGPTEETEAPTEPEYVYPDNWSRPALMFAVENGILKGDAMHNLNPEKNITRAEMAAVLVRLLGAEGSADLSAYADADPAAWYYTELSAAVAAGIFNGTTATTIAPMASITREQAMVVLCRAFGIAAINHSAYEEFTDGNTIAEYARPCVGALRYMELVKGYSDGSIKPKDPISRAEVAQLLFNLFDTIAATPEEIPSKGRVLYKGTEPLPEELSLDGSLILAQGTPKELSISNWSIRDSLVIRCKDGIDLELSGLSTRQLVVCAAGTVRARVNEVWLGGSGVSYIGDATYLGSLIGKHTAAGEYVNILIRGGSIDIDGTALDLVLGPYCGVSLNQSCRSIETGPDTKIYLDGSCESIALGNNARMEATGGCDTVSMNLLAQLTLGGSCKTATLGVEAVLNMGGSCESAVLDTAARMEAGGSCTTAILGEKSVMILKGACDSVVLGTYASLEAAGPCSSLSLGQRSKVMLEGSCTTATLEHMAYLKMNGSCESAVLGSYAVMDATGDCNTAVLAQSAVLKIGGTAQTVTMGKSSRLEVGTKLGSVTMDESTTLVLKGEAEEITVNGENATIQGGGKAALITIHAGGSKVDIAADTINNIWYDTYGRDYDNALKDVKTMRVPCTVLYDTFLCKNQDLTGYILPLPKGSIVYNEWHPAGDVFKVSYIDKDGKEWQGWTDRWACNIPDNAATTDGKLDYSKATKEGFVDKRGYDSSTRYLVWISRYTQKVIVFQGSKGNWELIKTMPCSSGSNNTPTPAGSFTIYSRTSRWYFDSYYADYVSIFNGGHAFHTILMNYDDTVYDGRVGIPLSHGCVRMLPEDCAYIYKLPMGTRVIVY